MFETTKPGLPDPMNLLKLVADADHSPNKIDVGLGVYRDENGEYYEFRTIKEAKMLLAAENVAHDYGPTTGNPTFNRLAAELLFGEQSSLLQRVCTVQTLSGTGANHLAALILSRTARDNGRMPRVYLGTPGWGNHEPLFHLPGFDVVKYQYYDFENHCVDFESIMTVVNDAANGSIFVLQACCHNPTAADPSREEWKTLAMAMKARGHFPVFDVAYMGLGDGLVEDAYAVRLFAEMGFELAACQSFAKNFGLYGERVGALHILCHDADFAENVEGQLRNLIRWEFSSAPLYGARLVTKILSDASLKMAWQKELGEIRERLKSTRTQLAEAFTQLQTPDEWQFIESSRGLFSLLPLQSAQCERLRNDHIYMAPNGRITVSGISVKSLDRFVRAVDAEIRLSSSCM